MKPKERSGDDNDMGWETIALKLFQHQKHIQGSVLKRAFVIKNLGKKKKTNLLYLA